jgi:hypothetical protein
MAEAITETSKKQMEAIVLSLHDGYQIYRNVNMIRIKDRRYSLMVMVDYMPMVGEINGSLTILCDENEIQIDHITGFYFIKGNVFKLLIKEDDYVE